MGIFLLAVQLMLFFSVKAEQHQYKVVLENVTLEYVDHRYVDVTLGIYKIKQSYVPNITITMKCDLPENTKVSAKAFKMVGNEYRVPVLQVRKTVKDALEMELFDLQTVLVDIARPPLVWPLKKGVTHHLQGWIPDSTKFPPNLPGGKWKTEITEEFNNKTKLFSAHVYLKIEY